MKCTVLRAFKYKGKTVLPAASDAKTPKTLEVEKSDVAYLVSTKRVKAPKEEE
jgi:hypothetical protein